MDKEIFKKVVLEDSEALKELAKNKEGCKMEHINIADINLKVAEIIKKQLTEVSFNTWCKGIKEAFMEGSNIVVSVQNNFEKDIIEERYLTVFNTAYYQFKDEINYNKIIIRLNENQYEEKPKDKLKINFKEEHAINTANQMKEIADKRNAKFIDIKKEIERTLKKILNTVCMMAEKGDYATSYICNNNESFFIENIIEELEKLGFKIRVTDFENQGKAIKIQW